MRTPEHIGAHFLVCYVALVALRLLQLLTGLPCGRIGDELAQLTWTSLDANWWVGGHRTADSDAIADAVGLPGLKLKNLRTADMRSFAAQARRWRLPHVQ